MMGWPNGRGPPLRKNLRSIKGLILLLAVWVDMAQRKK